MEKFENIFIDDTKNVERVSSKEYLKKGDIAIIDQGKELIVGYTNNKDYKMCKEERIVFGDHTRVFKYVNIPFVTGADGTKVLKLKDSNKCYYKYFYYYLLHSYIPNTGYNRHFKWVKELEFDIPQIDKQIAIVNKLDKVQEIIDIRKKQIEELDELIKSQFIEMFGDPILNDKNFLYKEIGEISEIVTGTTPDTTNNDNWNGDINWITPAEINNDTFYVFETERKITEKGRKSKSLTLMPKGTVIFSTRAPIGKTAIAEIEMCCNQGFKNCICNENINNVYLYYVLKNNTEYFNNLGTGATFKELSKRVFEKIKISVPPIELQNKFADLVKQINKHKFEIQKSLEEIQKLQESLMNKYFG